MVQEIASPYWEWIEKLAQEKRYSYFSKLKDFPFGQEILALSPQEKKSFIFAIFQWLENRSNEENAVDYNIRTIVVQLIQPKFNFEHDEIIALMEGWERNFASCSYGEWGIDKIIKVIAKYLQKSPVTSELKATAARIINDLEGGKRYYNVTEMRRLALKLRKLVNIEAPILVEGEAWADTAIQYLQTLEAQEQKNWQELLSYCADSNSSKPTAKWLKQGHTLLATIGVDRFQEQVSNWFYLVDRPRTQTRENYPHAELMMDERNADILKGLVWLCKEQDAPEITRALASLAISAYRKLKGFGPRCIRLGNACIWVLGQIPGQEGIAQLTVLKMRLKQGSAQKAIAKALTEASQRLHIAPADLEEMTAPTYGLETVGMRRETLGEFTAELVVTGTSSTELRWYKPDGKRQKSVPKAVKDNYPEQLRTLKQATQEIRKLLPPQRDRLESFYLNPKQWQLTTWQERYLNHPLVGTLARRLIWLFSDGESKATGIWYEGQIVDSQNQPLDWLKASTQVELWHPIQASIDTITAWRDWLLEHQVSQPFKQAYRELYLLTDAERNTNVYSNRFAAHILKQHQFNALCHARSWQNSLRLMVDDDYPPARIDIPAWQLRAEFWVESIGGDYGTDTTDAGTYLYLTTDQVRFYRINSAQNYAHASGGGYYALGESAQPLPLEAIPPLVFTEVMRDVDLFVGVASVGNDPNWSDGGPEARYYDYWQGYSFGELTETAKTRQQVLQRLIPRLKIAPQCEINDKFLVVKGEIRTYKIHLGSGNILMSPHDQYLCIVPAQGKAVEGQTNQVFLPFEGDKMMAIILSKAFLLAADTKITDPTIISQIQL